MARFIGRSLRLPTLLQLLLIAAAIYSSLALFSHFIEKPKYQKTFLEVHASRTEPFVVEAAENLYQAFMAQPGVLPRDILRELEARQAVVEAAIIDCNADVYFSTNSASTGTNFLSNEARYSHSNLVVLDKALFRQAATNGAPISRNINDSSRYQLHPLPCFTNEGGAHDYALLFTYLDWENLIQQDLAIVEEAVWSERIRWLILIAAISLIVCALIVPRIARLKRVIQSAVEGDYTNKYGKDRFDELDILGQSIDRLFQAFRTKIDETEQAAVEYALGYAAFEKGDQAICIFSAELRVIDLNVAYESQTGRNHKEMTGRSLLSILPEELVGETPNDLIDQNLIDGPEQEAWGVKKNGEKYRKAFRVFSQRGDDKQIQYLFYVERDITREFDQRQELEKRAKTDPLTGIYNRRRFDIDLITAFSVDQQKIAVGIINLDSMREINSEYGKNTGDRVIIEAGGRLLLSVSGTRNSVYRFEGDEFYILFQGFDSQQELERHARAILSSLVGEFGDGGISAIEITAGLGVAAFDNNNVEDTDVVLDQANLALRHAKTSGRSKVVLANDKVLAAQRRVLSISLALKSSKLTQQLQISYLPKIDIEHGILSGAEAIISWESPQIDTLSKEEWMAIADKTGDITRIDEWTIDQALQDIIAFTKQIDGFQTSIPVSSCQLTKPSFANDLVHKIKSLDIAPDCIALEIAERSLMENKEVAIPTIKKLRKVGISIHIEDFGIGYKSSRDLTDLPFDALKINKIFLDKQPNLKVIKTIFSVARSMNIPVIAEGVESTYHLNLLKQMGCEYCLGYLYSEPLALGTNSDPKAILSYWQKSIETVMP